MLFFVITTVDKKGIQELEMQMQVQSPETEQADHYLVLSFQFLLNICLWRIAYQLLQSAHLMINDVLAASLTEAVS